LTFNVTNNFNAITTAQYNFNATTRVFTPTQHSPQRPRTIHESCSSGGYVLGAITGRRWTETPTSILAFISESAFIGGYFSCVFSPV
jgi:hypothetical protein